MFMSEKQEMIQLKVIDGGEEKVLEVPRGSNLRKVLLKHGISPYTKWTKNLNCGGNGICATCGVWIVGNELEARHWHDRLAQQFGYPRLSCQIRINQPMTISLVDKVIWGKRNKIK
jgi:ferredoxin